MVALARTPTASVEASASVGLGVSLTVRNIDHGFVLHGDYLPVLEDVSFQVEPGEFVALQRSEERRVGKECRTVCRYRW